MNSLNYNNSILFIGPLLALLSSLIILSKFSLFFLTFCLIGYLGIALAILYRINGLILSSLLMSTFLAYEYMSAHAELLSAFLWNVGLAVSFMLSQWLTVTSLLAVEEDHLEEAAKKENLRCEIELLKNEIEVTQKKNLFQKQQLTELQDEITKTKEQAEKVSKALTSESQEKEKRLNEILGQLKHVRSKLEESEKQLELQRKQTKRFEELESANKLMQKENQQLNESLLSIQKEKTLIETERDQAVKLAADPDRSIRIIEGKYSQLKEQFEMKNQMLENTRKELFQTQEQLQKLELEKSEKLQSPDPEQLSIERYLIKMGNEYENRCSEYQQEIDALSDMVSSLINQQLK